MGVQKKTIDGHEVTIAPLGARVASKMLARLIRLAGPALGQILGGVRAAAEDDDALVMLAQGVSHLAGQVTDAEHDAVVDGLLAGAVLDGKGLLQVMEIALQGKVLTLYKIVAFAIQVNYPDFFAAWSARAAAAPAGSPSTG